MCLIPLSRVLDLAWSWCTASFVNIVGSYGVSPSLSCCDELIFFTFEASLLSGWILLWIWEHLMYVLHVDTRGDNRVFYWFTWCMFWHSTRGYPMWHWGNLYIAVDARFRPTFSGKKLGTLSEYFCIRLNIMNLKLFDAYRIINSRILVVTLEYLGDIRVGWCVSYGVILVCTSGLFVTLIGIAQ